MGTPTFLILQGLRELLLRVPQERCCAPRFPSDRFNLRSRLFFSSTPNFPWVTRLKGKLLAGAVAPALFALPAWCQDESQRKPGENVRSPSLTFLLAKFPSASMTLDLSKIK